VRSSRSRSRPVTLSAFCIHLVQKAEIVAVSGSAGGIHSVLGLQRRLVVLDEAATKVLGLKDLNRPPRAVLGLVLLGFAFALFRLAEGDLDGAGFLAVLFAFTLLVTFVNRNRKRSSRGEHRPKT